MENPFDQFDEPAAATAEANPFDQFDAPEPVAAAPAPAPQFQGIGSIRPRPGGSLPAPAPVEVAARAPEYVDDGLPIVLRRDIVDTTRLPLNPDPAESLAQGLSTTLDVQRQRYPDLQPAPSIPSVEAAQEPRNWGEMTAGEGVEALLKGVPRGGAQAVGDTLAGINIADSRMARDFAQRIQRYRRGELLDIHPYAKTISEAEAEDARAKKVLDKMQPEQISALEQSLATRFNPLEGGLYQAGESLKQSTGEMFPLNTQQEASIPGQVGSGFGQMAATIPLAMAGPVGVLAATASGSFQMGKQGFDEALAAGADIDTAYKSFSDNALIGLTEILPVSHLLARLDKITGGRVRSFAMEGIKQAFEEGGQEGVQQFLSNTVAQQLYAPERQLWDGVLQSAGIGALVGGPAGAVGGAVAPRQDAQTGVSASEASLAAPPALAGGNPFDQFDAQPTPQGVPQGAVEASAILPQVQPEPAVAPPPAAAAPVSPQPMPTSAEIAPVAPAPTVTRAEIQSLLDDPRTAAEIAAADRAAAAEQAAMQQTVQETATAPIAAEPDGSQMAATPVETQVITPVTTQDSIARIEPAGEIRQNLTKSAEIVGDGTKAAPVKITTGAELRDMGGVINQNATDAQKEAGNYKRLHAALDGEGISFGIETGNGQPRVGPGGSWRLENSPADYGYIKGTRGADGDQIDAYFADGPIKGPVYVIDQIDAETGKFDEHKTILGANDQAEAVRIYNAGFSDGKGPQRMGAISQMGWPQFKNWIRRPGARKRPVAWKAPAASPSAVGPGTAGALQGSAAPSPSGRIDPKTLRDTDRKGILWVARKLGGLRDTGGDLKSIGVRQPGVINNRNGIDLDRFGEWLFQHDYDVKDDADPQTWDINKVHQLIRDETHGKKAYPIADQATIKEEDAASFQAERQNEAIDDAHSWGRKLMGRDIDAAKAEEIAKRFVTRDYDTIEEAAMDVLEDDMIRLIDETSAAAEEPFDDIADIPFDMPTKETDRGQEPGQVHQTGGETRQEPEGASRQAPEAARGGEGAAANQGPPRVAPKTRKAKGPSYLDRMRNYYQPGRIVRGYGSTFDKVISFNPTGENWSVTVQASDRDGNPVDDKRIRTHTTPPDERDLLAWEKTNPVPEKTDQGMQSVMPGMEQSETQKRDAKRAKNLDVKDGLFAPRETAAEDEGQTSLQEPKKGSLGDLGVTKKTEPTVEMTPEQARDKGRQTVERIDEKITTGNLKSEKAWKRRGEAYETAIKLIEQMTGVTDLKLVIADSLSYEGRNIGGFFQAMDKMLGVAITTNDTDPAWTLGHEVMHLFRQTGLIDDATWDQLVAAAEKGKWLQRYEVDRRWGDSLTDAQKMEEAIAEAYGEYVQGRLKGVPQEARSIFGKIKEFLRRLRQALRAKFGWETAEDIFGKAFSGYYAKPTGIGDVARTDTFAGTSLMAMGAVPPTPRAKPPFSVSTLMKDFKTRPIDEAFRLPFRILGHLPGKAGKAFEIDQNRVWVPSKKVFALWKKFVEDATFEEGGRFGFLNPYLEQARVQLGIDLGLTEEYQNQRQKRKLDARSIMFKGEQALEKIQAAKLTADQQKALYEAMTGEPIKDISILGLAESLATDIAEMGDEAVRLGLISQESLDRNKFAYMHRVYLQHETRNGAAAKFAASVLRRRRVRFLGDAFKGRGMYQKVTYAQIAKDAGNPNVLISQGSKISVFDVLSPDGTRTIKRVYLPKSQASQASKEWQFKGDFEVRSKVKDEIVIWRDFTKNERESMGEIMDARYQLARTYQILANDLATGRFFDDIAQNRDWATDVEPPRDQWSETKDWSRFGPNEGIEWVKVPTDKLPKSDAKRWGALAGKFVRAEIWRDLNETEIAQSPQLWRKLMNQWKLNHTARSVGVHVRNVMSNMMFMDLADVTFVDLHNGIKSFLTKDQYYQDAVEHGAFGADMISEEIRKKYLEPMLKEILREAKPNAGTASIMNSLQRMSISIYAKAKAIDNKMVDAYRLEDEVFRLAMYHKMRTDGYNAVEAAEAARDQFINYDIQAPAINWLRQTVLPFLSYTYRAVPLIAKNTVMRPWKIAKYVALFQMLDMLSYSLSPGDDEEDDALKPDFERQSATLGVIPIGDELMRLGTIDDDTYYLRVSDYMPGGNLLDQSPNGLPRIFNPGFVVGVGMELFMNKNAFTGDEIYSKAGDGAWDNTKAISNHLWKWWMPSSPWVPGSHYWDKIGSGMAGELDSVGEEVSPYLAAAQSFGVKITKVNKENAKKRIEKFTNFDLSELDDRIYDIRRQVNRNKMSEEDGLEKIAEIKRQKKEIADEAIRRLNAGKGNK